MLCRDRTGASFESAVDDLLDGMARCGAAVAYARYEMQIAVARWPKIMAVALSGHRECSSDRTWIT